MYIDTFATCFLRVLSTSESPPLYKTLPCSWMHWDYFHFFFSLSVFCLASIVTVIRLVNDTVDNIESEGMKENPLLTPLSSLCLSFRRQHICSAAEQKDLLNAAEPLPFSPRSYYELNILLRFLIFVVSFWHRISLCFSFSPLVSGLFVSLCLWLSLSLCLCSVKHGQRTAA